MKMNRIKYWSLLCCLILLLASCDDEEEVTSQDDDQDEVIDMDVSERVANITVTGDVEFSFENTEIQTDSGPISSDEIDYTLVRVFVFDNNTNPGQSVSFGFYMPDGEGSIPSNGEIPVLMFDAADENTYASVNVTANAKLYDSIEETVGTITITNSSEATNSFDAEFELQNVFSFLDSTTVEVSGSFSF